MIHSITLNNETKRWKKEQNDSIRDPRSLLNYLKLPESMLSEIELAHKLFPIRVTKSYLSRIEKNNPFDPLLLQVLPSLKELDQNDNYSSDPVGDKAAEIIPGLLQKYHGRVLLTLTGACGVHCRYCFRRHFDYRASNPLSTNWHKCIEYINQEKQLFEVILSGGDPLSLSDDKLSTIASDIESIPHIELLRIHSRQPIISPSRINKEFLKWTTNSRLKIILVLHINHSNEIDEQVSDMLYTLNNHNIQLLNQSVLLSGINDDLDTLHQLSRKLIQNNVLPYYLHLLDKTQGVSHFDVNKERAKKLITDLQSRLPGYLVPKLVEEIPGETHKTNVI